MLYSASLIPKLSAYSTQVQRSPWVVISRVWRRAWEYNALFLWMTSTYNDDSITTHHHLVNGWEYCSPIIVYYFAHQKYLCVWYCISVCMLCIIFYVHVSMRLQCIVVPLMSTHCTRTYVHVRMCIHVYNGAPIHYQCWPLHVYYIYIHACMFIFTGASVHYHSPNVEYRCLYLSWLITPSQMSTQVSSFCTVCTIWVWCIGSGFPFFPSSATNLLSALFPYVLEHILHWVTFSCNIYLAPCIYRCSQPRELWFIA